MDEGVSCNSKGSKGLGLGAKDLSVSYMRINVLAYAICSSYFIINMLLNCLSCQITMTCNWSVYVKGELLTVMGIAIDYGLLT